MSLFKRIIRELTSPDTTTEKSKPSIKTPPRNLEGLQFNITSPWNDGSNTAVNAPIPERGIFITGSAGSGKTKTLIQPILAQFIEQGYTGLMYDYKNPILSTHVFSCFRMSNKQEVKDYYINFTDMTRTHQVNPLHPDLLTRSAYADMFAETLLSNLSDEFIKSPNFFTRSSKGLLSAVIWYLAAERPNYCTLPHALRMILTKDIEKLLNTISSNEESEARVASITSGLKSANQTAGVISTLQGMLAPLTTPEITWVLSGDDFKLDLNNPFDKKFLSVANTPELASVTSPVISLLFSSALLNMNNQGKEKSCVVIDELPTIYIPGLDTIPATGRENKIATVLGVQDYAQLEDKYTEKKAEVIASVLNNHLYGKTTNVKTAERISKLFGMVDQTYRSTSYSESAADVSQRILSNGGQQSPTQSISYSTQQRPRIKPAEVLNLNSGEFIGTLVGSWKNEFKKQLELKEYESIPIPEFKTDIDLRGNMNRIREEVKAIIDGNL